ncbi:hypothetical protein BC829DRAFT_88736 [Chytridium lagenaria]|nr:hypothetical protein BC829DRAFT_88736 [Chytridium lagenaria]
MDNLDLDLNFTLSTATLEQKQRELDATSRRVHLLEQISNVQRDLLTRGGATSSEILESLQNELTGRWRYKERRKGDEAWSRETEDSNGTNDGCRDGIVRQRRATVGAIMSAGSSVGSGKEKSLSAGEEEGGRR